MITKEGYTTEELDVIDSCKDPRSIQRFLDSLTYDQSAYSSGQTTATSFRRTISDKKAMCLGGAYTGAHLLELLGQRPRLLSINARPFGHAVAIYDEREMLGGLGMSRHKILTYRPPRFSSEWELAESYIFSLRGLGFRVTGFEIEELKALEEIVDWRFSQRDVELLINQALIRNKELKEKFIRKLKRGNKAADNKQLIFEKF